MDKDLVIAILMGIAAGAGASAITKWIYKKIEERKATKAQKKDD